MEVLENFIALENTIDIVFLLRHSRYQILRYFAKHLSFIDSMSCWKFQMQSKTILR